MKYWCILNLFDVKFDIVLVFWWYEFFYLFLVKVVGKKDKFLDVERDLEKLCKFVCGVNIMKNG